MNPPPGLIDKGGLPGAPQHGIGRPCKVGKEEIVGLLKALDLFVQEDPEERRQAWADSLKELLDTLGEIPNTEVYLSHGTEIPLVTLEMNEEALGLTAIDLAVQLQEGSPSIHVNPGRLREGVVAFGPLCLKPGEPAVVGRKVRELLL